MELDALRDRLGAVVESSPWFAEAPQIVLAQLVDARRQISRTRDAIGRQRLRLDGFDWLRWALGEIAAEPAVRGSAPALWIAPEGGGSRIPVMRDGVPARCVDPDWVEDDRAPVVEIDPAHLFELVAGGGQREIDGYVAREALEALVRALRKAGVQRLPELCP